MNLTPEQLKQNAAAMLAYAEGKPVENRPLYGGKWLGGEPTWAIQQYEYRPAPDPIASGHNPDKLTVSQVGDGWRLLDEDEIHDRHRLFVEIQQWLPPKWDDTGFIGNYKPAIYRTRLTREELAALDKPSAPKAEPWDSPEDVPGPVCWMRETDISCARMVIALPYAGVVVGCTGEGKLVRWDELSQWQHSTDRITWKPCTKEAKA